MSDAPSLLPRAHAAGLGRRRFLTLVAGGAGLSGCARTSSRSRGTSTAVGGSSGGADSTGSGEASAYRLEEGKTIDRGFVVDNVLHATEEGLHFSLHVPDAYDGSKPYALYVALPGWEGLWFQGVGAHLQEDFPFVANDYVADMIVASPQLEDWGETSDRQTIALTQWLLSTYNVAADRMVLSGCSGGGETASLVMGTRPELFAAVLHCISQWDGDIEPLIAARVPVYMATGENDDYYGPSSVRETYEKLRSGYMAQGLGEEEVSRLVTLDVKPASYFGETGRKNGQHMTGGVLFPHDEEIMGWLFNHAR